MAFCGLNAGATTTKLTAPVRLEHANRQSPAVSEGPVATRCWHAQLNSLSQPIYMWVQASCLAEDISRDHSSLYSDMVATIETHMSPTPSGVCNMQAACAE